MTEASQQFSKLVEAGKWAANMASSYLSEAQKHLSDVAPKLKDLAGKINGTENVKAAFDELQKTFNGSGWHLAGQGCSFMTGFIFFNGVKNMLTNQNCSAIGSVALATAWACAGLAMAGTENMEPLTNAALAGVAVNVAITGAKVLAQLCRCCCCCCCGGRAKVIKVE